MTDPQQIPASLRGPAAQPPQPTYTAPSPGWNGEPCQARRITAVVADDGAFPEYWARGVVGTRRKAVEVTYGGDTFYLDDEDGSGWAKVTAGGSPRHGHRSLTVDPDTIQPREDLPPTTGNTGPEGGTA